MSRSKIEELIESKEIRAFCRRCGSGNRKTLCQGRVPHLTVYQYRDVVRSDDTSPSGITASEMTTYGLAAQYEAPKNAKAKQAIEDVRLKVRTWGELKDEFLESLTVPRGSVREGAFAL